MKMLKLRWLKGNGRIFDLAFCGIFKVVKVKSKLVNGLLFIASFMDGSDIKYLEFQLIAKCY